MDQDPLTGILADTGPKDHVEPVVMGYKSWTKMGLECDDPDVNWIIHDRNGIRCLDTGKPVKLRRMK